MLNMWVIRREIDVHSPRGDEEQVARRCHVGLFTAICLLFASVFPMSIKASCRFLTINTAGIGLFISTKHVYMFQTIDSRINISFSLTKTSL